MLKIEGLQKSYSNFSLNCTLEVPKGRITGLIGQNGAGKSTTLKGILDLISLDGGKITVFGKDHHTLTEKEKERIGVVLSDSFFSGYLTVKDLIPILQGLYEHFDSAYFCKQLERFELPKEKRIKEFSTGMRAKLKVLVAMSHQADLLLLDEPTAGLDVIAREEVLLILREFMEEKEDRSILISSHISSDLETLCDDLYLIHHGKIIFCEDTPTLLGQYGVLKVEESQYASMDQQYFLAVKKEPYGYCCLTDQKQFYRENYPQIVIENSKIDDVIVLMTQGVDK